MMIVSAQSATLRDTPVDFLPLRLKRYFFGIDTDDIYEIRLRISRPVCVVGKLGKSYITSVGKLSKKADKGIVISRKDIEDAVEILTSSSIYSYADEIKNGYITAYGGHRVGVCGTMTADGEFMTDISCLNYRFAREVMGVADEVIDGILNNGQVKSTLIVSRPGCGKTTFLRDLVRQISDRGINISVIDERGEICAVCEGIPGFEVGSCTDIIDRCSKRYGMTLMLRTMSPRVIAVDEFDFAADADVISSASRSGVSVFATAHCGDWRREIPKDILSQFKCIIVLSDKKGPGTVEEVVYV